MHAVIKFTHVSLYASGITNRLTHTNRKEKRNFQFSFQIISKCQWYQLPSFSYLIKGIKLNAWIFATRKQRLARSWYRGRKKFNYFEAFFLDLLYYDFLQNL